MYQLAITIGIFIAYAVDQVLTNSDAWRAMLGVSAIPGLLLVLAIWPMPSRLAGCIQREREHEARDVICQLRTRL